MLRNIYKVIIVFFYVHVLFQATYKVTWHITSNQRRFDVTWCCTIVGIDLVLYDSREVYMNNNSSNICSRS